LGYLLLQVTVFAQVTSCVLMFERRCTEEPSVGRTSTGSSSISRARWPSGEGEASRRDAGADLRESCLADPVVGTNAAKPHGNSATVTDGGSYRIFMTDPHLRATRHVVSDGKRCAPAPETQFAAHW